MAALDLAVAGHVHLVAGPLYHSAPFSFAHLTHVFGGTVVVMRKFDPEDALAAIARHRVTSTFMAPTLVKRIVDLPDAVRRRHDVSSMKVLVVAGAPCPMRVKEEATTLFGPAFSAYIGVRSYGSASAYAVGDVIRGNTISGVDYCGILASFGFPFDDDGPRPIDE